MKKGKIIEDILRLEQAVAMCDSEIAGIRGKHDRLKQIIYSGQRQRLFRELPLKYADTVFYTRKNDFRVMASHSLQRKNSFCPVTDMELGVKDEKIVVLCEECIKTDNGVVFKFSDPYGYFFSMPVDMPYEKAVAYLDCVVYTTVSSCRERDVEYRDDFFKMLSEKKNYGFFFRESEIVQNIYKVGSMEFSGFSLYGENGKGRDLILSTFVGYALRYKYVNTEAEAIEAITDIQNYARIRDGGLLVKRFSPTEVRLIDNDGTMYSFFYSGEELFFIEEPGHGVATWKNADVPMDIMYASEMRNSTGKEFKVLLEEFRKMPEEQKNEYAEHVRERQVEQRLQYNIDVTCRKVGEECLRRIRGEADEWRKHKVVLPKWSELDILEDKVCYNKYKSRRKLLLTRKELLERYEHLCLRVKDEWYYFKLLLKYRYNNLEGDVKCDKAGQIISTSGMNGWHINLIRNPDYYSKWRGTFFDEHHRFVSECLVSYNKKCAGRNMYVEEHLEEHYYNVVYGAKSKWEDMSNPNIGMGKLRKMFGTSAADDRVCYYVGYCDSVLCDGDQVKMHIIDPNAEVTFEDVKVPQEIVSQAVGRMCVLGYAYNFFDEKARFLELQILPYTLTEKIGEYEDDVIVCCNEDVALVGRSYNSSEETGFILM